MYLSSRGTKPGILVVEEADRKKDGTSGSEENKGGKKVIGVDTP